jgi:flagellar basal-body rod protein FlgC
MDPLDTSIGVAASGLRAQSMRFRVVSENLANAEATGMRPGADPYRRKTVSFAAELDNAGAARVVLKRIGADPSPFRLENRPGDPAASPAGIVKLPNVNPIVEMADMREASRGYEANLQVIKQAREMISMTIDLLRGA